VLLAAMICFATSDPLSAKKPPPIKRTYFTVNVGLETETGIDVACMRFTSSKVCLEPADYPTICGPWRFTDNGTSEMGLSYRIAWNASGIELVLEGQARIDDSGPGSSIAGAGRFAADELGVESNASFAGKEVKKKTCRKLAALFKPLAHQWTATQCLDRARFRDPASSPFVLPYPIGEAYQIGQTYCDGSGSHRSSFAYDIDMPVGTQVVSIADGVVWMAIDEFVNGDHRDEHSNDIWIEHDDGSVADYAHLRHGGFLVQPGDRVTAGQAIAASGDTGTVVPHLHLAVFSSRDALDENSIPLNFRNAGGQLDERGGLRHGGTYEALPW
jgi:murein DD-endopeptidase MepM/ murein hydrolase activator NlpD